MLLLHLALAGVLAVVVVVMLQVIPPHSQEDQEHPVKVTQVEVVYIQRLVAAWLLAAVVELELLVVLVQELLQEPVVLG
jgi:hypothetical protein